MRPALAITLLSHLYGIVPKEGETAVSLLARQVFGDSLFYYVIPTATTLILILATNTSYADFPRLSSLLAKDKYLPRQLASLGDRLVFSNGILELSFAAALLILMFGGDTHSLIPLYAVGVFLSFTLSQTGMVVHHIRCREKGWQRSLVFNVVGAFTTAGVLLVIGATKFSHGAWVVILLIPTFVFVFKQIHKHYVYANEKLVRPAGLPLEAKPLKHTAIVPVSGIHNGVISAVSYALSISKDVRAVYVEFSPEVAEKLKKEWEETIPLVPLVILKSPYRSVIAPIVKYIYRVEREMDDDIVTVIIPEFVTKRWYHQLLHNQTAIVLSLALRGRKDIVVTSVRLRFNAEALQVAATME